MKTTAMEPSKPTQELVARIKLGAYEHLQETPQENPARGARCRRGGTRGGGPSRGAIVFGKPARNAASAVAARGRHPPGSNPTRLTS